MKLKTVRLEDVRPYENNPRRNDGAVDAVAESIRQCGYVAPIVVDEEMVILAGHTRYKALTRLGHTTAKVLIAEQKRKYRILDNKTGEIAEWDEDLLRSELEGLDFGGFDFGLLDLAAPEVESPEDVFEDEPPAPPQNPRTKRGELWQLGRHRVMCGDATSSADVQLLTGGAQMDMLLTDPPYNVDYTGGTKDALKIENDCMDGAKYRTFLETALAAAASAMKPGAAFYVWHADSEGLNVRQAAENAGLHPRQVLIWAKSAFTLSRQDYQWKHEPCLYGWKDGAAHYFVSSRNLSTVIEDERPNPAKLSKQELVDMVKALTEDKEPTTVLHEDKPARSAEHPTMKPVRLIARLLHNSSAHGETVLDVFGGSGTTLIAAEQLGRRAYLMELDPKYVDVIIDRWEKLTGEKAVRIDGV